MKTQWSCVWPKIFRLKIAKWILVIDIPRNSSMAWMINVVNFIFIFIIEFSELWVGKLSIGVIFLVYCCPCFFIIKSCLTCDPTDYSPPGFFVSETFQARGLEWVAISFYRGSSQPREWIQVSCIAGGFFTLRDQGSPLSFYFK